MMTKVTARARPTELRQSLTETSSGDMWRRRAVILINMLGLGAMEPPLLLQTGVVRHVPDPPIPGFNSDKVNLSRWAYQMGLPDAALAMASFAVNIPLAAVGKADRARSQPLLPLLASAKSAIDAAISLRYLYQMPTREKAWCDYCLAGAAAAIGAFALTLPEASRALRRLRT